MDRLSIYNGALRLIGERKLASLTEEREPRRALDGVWDDDGVRRCLERGQWVFARRSAQLDYDADYDAPFGFARQFAKPDDFVRTCAVCTDPYYTSPLLQYTEEAGFWFADWDTIYVTYVSDDESYGTNYSAWSSSFGEYVEAYFAVRIAPKTVSDQKLIDLKKDEKRLLHRALADNAQALPTKMKPPGNWLSSRRRGTTGNDGGNRGSLTG